MEYKVNPIILQVLPELNSGGVERGTIEVSKALKDKNIISYVTSSGGSLVEKLNKMDVVHFKLPLKSKNPYMIISNIFSLVKIIKSNNINIIHARSRGPAWSAYFAAKITKIKFITSFHGIYSFNNILKKYYNSIMLKSDYIIAVSNFVKNHIDKNYKKYKNIKIIHRGVDPYYFNPDRFTHIEINKIRADLNIPDRKIILIPGRLTSWKGHIYLIEALSKITQPFYCIIVGNHSKNNYLTNIKSDIYKYNLENMINILPNQKNMPMIYMLSDIVISASIRPEAFGRVIIEAQAMKKLVISTNIGGATETIINEKTGWFAPINDSDGFSKIIDNILQLNKEESKKIGIAARKNIIDNFSLKEMTDKTIEIYKNILEEINE